MIIKVSVSKRFQLKVIPGFKDVFFRNHGERHYLGGSNILPAPLDEQSEAEEIARLGTDWDQEAKAALIEHNLRLVVYIARKFDQTATGLDDLISIGTIGLIKAVNTFNSSRNVRLATYASRCIQNEILMYLRKNRRAGLEVSMDEPLNIYGDGEKLFLSDILGTDENLIDRNLEEEAERTLLNAAISTLSDRERNILELRYGINRDECEKMTQKDVARLLGISQSYISRLEKEIIRRLRSEMARFR